MGDYFEIQDVPGLRNVPAGVQVTVRNNTGFTYMHYNQQIHYLQYVLQQAALAVVRRYQPRPNERQALQTLGRIQLVARDRDHHRVSQVTMTIRNITVREMERLFDLQSGDDMELYDFDWQFIFMAGELSFGGAHSVRKPAYVKSNHYKECWKPQKYFKDDLNCAAFALIYALQEGINPGRINTAMKKKVWQVQEKLGWSEFIRPSQIKDFLKLPPYRHIQVVVITVGLSDFSDTTFTGPDWIHVLPEGATLRARPENVVHLLFDQNTNHYAVCASLKDVLYAHRSSLCGMCHVAYGPEDPCQCDAENQEAIEEERVLRALARRQRYCKTCESPNNECTCPKKKHPCSCGTSAGTSHRCISFAKPDDSKKEFLVGPFDPENPVYTLWAYDIESAQTLVPGEYVHGFEMNEEGSEYVSENNKPKLVAINRTYHKVNLVVCQDVFNPTNKHVFKGDDALDLFVTFMVKSYNNGYNLCYAHNGSGYDTRLVYESLTKTGAKIKHSMITRGCKQLLLKVGKCKFRDSLRFLPGSLAKLATSFFPGDSLVRKGHFPHLFNTEENYGYEGPLPAKKYFDLATVMKSPKDLAEFHSWHDELTAQGYIWNFQSNCWHTAKTMWMC